MSEATISVDAWQELEKIIDSGNAEHLAMFLQLLAPGDTTYTISRLAEDKQTRMLSLLSQVQPEFAADLMEHLTDEHVADIISEMSPEHAAAIVDEMDSDEQTDVLSELHEDDAEAILQQMDPVEAEDARQRLEYDDHTAGGLMITEFLAYREDQDVDDVIHDLRVHADEHTEFEVRYLYVVDAKQRLQGVVTMRALVMAPRGRPLTALMVQHPDVVHVSTQLEDIEDYFDRHDYYAIPVLDEQGRLAGVVQRAAVQEALSERESDTFLKFSGIIGGEEIRNMPLGNRAVRRLTFLLPNILLSYLAVTIIAVFEPIIEQVTALAIFLPMVANLSGAAGNQAVAVSIRELSLGIVAPADLIRVWRKEAMVGFINGLIIGVLLGLVTWMTRPDLPLLGVIVAVSFAINSVLAVCLGAGLPLVLKRVGVDPAMMSSPILTTLTDMGSFLLVLGLAAMSLGAL